MPILVWYFVAAFTIFVAWWWVNSWRCSSANQISFTTKASFVVPRSLIQENEKTNYIPMLRCKQCFKNIYKYGNIPPMNDFGIVILGYCIHFFDSVAFIRLQCLISNAPCNFQWLCISNFACPNYINKVFVLFKARPCTLWDEPHLPC